MPDLAAARYSMIESQLRARGIADERVLAAMERVPRHEFVPQPYRDHAYEDAPLPIGGGQTISQPYVVALMLELLQIKPTDKILEIGTGSGYVTSLLAELTVPVFSVERHGALAESAREVLARLGYREVQIFTGDGTLGLPEAAPFDGVLVSAAAAGVPPALLAQLREGGRMIIPVGGSDSQELDLIQIVDGKAVVSRHERVRFVPLISES